MSKKEIFILKRGHESGQVTVEFILVFSFALSVVFMVMNSGFNYVKGYVQHYGTFMASRVYLVADSHTNNENFIPEKTTEEECEKFGLTNCQINEPSRNAQDKSEILSVGVFSRLELSMDVMGRIFGGEKINLVSESFLGKEPTRIECLKRVCYAMTGKETCDGLDITLYDNGC